ncbi:MAG: hypothetical protein KY460_03490 [Actinobacteria bacterium]|nr:hypothetical protein [Actinomycetota bacterium]
MSERVRRDASDEPMYDESMRDEADTRREHDERADDRGEMVSAEHGDDGRDTDLEYRSHDATREGIEESGRRREGVDESGRRREGVDETDRRPDGAAHGAEADAVRDDDRRIDRDPSSERTEPTAGPGATTEWSDDGLLSTDDRSSFQQRWDDIQVRFIDEPQQCVREADDLVSEVTSKIANRFSSARQDMEQRWEGGNEPTTEELRQAVQRYRDFFRRLVA